MHFTLGGKYMVCPDSIGNWVKVGVATDGTSPFYKRNRNSYDHITIPWLVNLVCDGYIHYTAKEQSTPVFVPGAGLRYGVLGEAPAVFKFDFEVRNNGGPAETARGGLNKDRPIFKFVGANTQAQRTNTRVRDDRNALSEWEGIKIIAFASVKEFWEALLAAQPPAAPPLPGALPGAPFDLWNHRLLDNSYYGPPSSVPSCVVPAFPIDALGARLETEFLARKRIGEASGFRVFVLVRQSGATGNVMLRETLKVCERFLKSGYRQLKVTFLTGNRQDEVRIHYY